MVSRRSIEFMKQFIDVGDCRRKKFSKTKFARMCNVDVTTFLTNLRRLSKYA